MGRAPCCTKIGLHRGPWTSREDKLLTKYIHSHGQGNWRSLPKKAGLLRCGKSCRLRWMNYLRPGIKRGNITPDEEDLIIRMHSLLGNRWSLIAGRLPGRTDNEIKNHWNTHLIKKLKKPLTKRMVKKKVNTGQDVSKIKLYTPRAVRIKSTVLLASPNDVTFEHKKSDGSYYIFDGNSGGDDLDVNFVNGFDFDMDMDLDLDFSVPALAGSSIENMYEEYLELVNDAHMDEEYANLDTIESLFM